MAGLVVLLAAVGVTSLLWSLLVGTLLPALTAFVTKQNASPRLKALLTALLAGVTGAIAGFLITPPQGWAQWEQVISSVAIAWAMAAVSYFFGWKPTGATDAISRSTPNFGLGKAVPPQAGSALNAVIYACTALGVSAWSSAFMLGTGTIWILWPTLAVILVLGVLTFSELPASAGPEVHSPATPSA